jgi:hypothetical protein
MQLPCDPVHAVDFDGFCHHFDGMRAAPQKSGSLQIIATVANGLDLSEFRGSLASFGFSIDYESGQFFQLSKTHKGNTIQFSVFFDEKRQIPIFITDAKKTDEIPSLLFEYLYLSADLSHLWIAPAVMKEIKDDLVSQYPELIITYFSAKRSNNTEIPAYRRANVERGIQYRGIDGKNALEEMEYYYGILPKILDFTIPNIGSFRIDNKGIITVKEGSISGIFNILNRIIVTVQPLQKAISNSTYSTREIGKSQFVYNIQTPWSLYFSKPIDDDTIARFLHEVESEEWSFTILNQNSNIQDLNLHARLIDNLSGALLDIETSLEGISVYPVDKPSLGSCMRFFELILESVDSTATVG